MDDLDDRLAALFAIPERAPDVAFVNEAALRLTAERRLAARLAAERQRTATLLLATVAVAAGVWLFARGSLFDEMTGGAQGSLAAIAVVMALWFAASGVGALASD